MYIRQLFAQKPCVFSMEVFPPKQTVGYEKLQATASISSISAGDRSVVESVNST